MNNVKSQLRSIEGSSSLLERLARSEKFLGIIASLRSIFRDNIYSTFIEKLENCGAHLTNARLIIDTSNQTYKFKEQVVLILSKLGRADQAGRSGSRKWRPFPSKLSRNSSPSRPSPSAAPKTCLSSTCSPCSTLPGAKRLRIARSQTCLIRGKGKLSPASGCWAKAGCPRSRGFSPERSLRGSGKQICSRSQR